MSSSEHGTALYSPHIAISDGTWLKRALLYWERIRRIVPDGVVPDDVRVVRAFQSAGLVVNTSPAPYRKAATGRFRECWSTSLRTTLQAKSDEVECRMSEEPWLLHPEKLGRMLAEELVRDGQAVDRDGWLQMDSRLGGAYMHALASTMSFEMRAPLVTDSVFAQQMGERIAYAGSLVNGEARDDAVPVVLDLKIEVPTPRHFGGITPDAIIAFRAKFAHERRAFREAVEEIRKSASEMTDPNQIHDFLETKRNKIQSALTEQRKSMRELCEDNIGSWMDLVGPTAAGVLAGQALPFDPNLGAVFGPIGFAFGLRKWYRERKEKERELNRQDPWHYIQLIRKNVA